MLGKRSVGTELLLSALLMAAAPAGIPSPSFRPEAGCWLELRYRPLHLGVVNAPPNHTYLYLRDESGRNWIVEGRPEFSTPRILWDRPWGRLRAHATEGARGYLGTDDAGADAREGERRELSCSVVDLVRAEARTFDRQNALAYSVTERNSNVLTRWLLGRAGVKGFTEPPNAVNWWGELGD